MSVDFTPDVTVITATHQRGDLLIERCLPSVWAQTYPSIEHLVIADGVDFDLRDRLADLGYDPHGVGGRRYLEMGRNNGMVGWAVRAAGSWLAAGEWICYLDDDNTFDPDHVAVMVAEARRAGVQLVCCAWRTPQGEVGGWTPPGTNHTDVGSILHHRDLLKLSAWQPGDGYAADGALVDRWVAAGVRWSFLPRPTLVYHPSGDPAAYAAWLRGMAAAR